MSEQTDNLTNLLIPYGLSVSESRVYLFLLKNPNSSALEISKNLHIGRTKVYRLLDKLKSKNLVEFQLDNRGLRFGATHPGKLEQLVNEKEQEVNILKKSLHSLLSHLNQINSNTSIQKSKVLFYEGLDGLKQVSWNSLQAKETLRVFEKEHISDFLPLDFSEKFRQAQVERQITTHDLTNKSSFQGFTNVTELIKNYSQFRYIDPNKLKINFEVLIYNDVYATYTYHESEIFCVEIHNPQLAAMQKQLFDFVWGQAIPMQFKDERGKAQIKEVS